MIEGHHTLPPLQLNGSILQDNTFAMAQGLAKLQKKAKSGGAAKKQQVRKQTVMNKGKKQFTAKRKSFLANGHHKAEHDTTKAINKRNESLVAAKALSSGTLPSQFFLKDLAVKGTQEQAEQTRKRNKKERKESNQTERLKKQLKKLGHDC
jgi:hypothetical protein